MFVVLVVAAVIVNYNNDNNQRRAICQGEYYGTVIIVTGRVGVSHWDGS